MPGGRREIGVAKELGRKGAQIGLGIDVKGGQSHRVRALGKLARRLEIGRVNADHRVFRKSAAAEG